MDTRRHKRTQKDTRGHNSTQAHTTEDNRTQQHTTGHMDGKKYFRVEKIFSRGGKKFFGVEKNYFLAEILGKFEKKIRVLKKNCRKKVPGPHNDGKT